MKYGSKLMFGFNAIQAGQKSATVNAEPRLIVNSTCGKFTITAPVSKALQIAVGENVMFLNNIANVEAAVAEQNDAVVAYAQENGIDITTREGQKALIDAFTVWAIAKGVPLFSKGQPVMGKERYTATDKQKYIDANAAELLATYRDELVARVGNPDASDEELIAAITIDDVDVPEYQVNSGSKTASSGSATGIGCQLGFTDTNVWNNLKEDLGADKEKKNRMFKVLLDQSFKTQFDNGKEALEITAYPIEFEKDEDPIIRNNK